MQCFCHSYSDFFILWFSCSITSTKDRLITKFSHFRLTSRDLVHWHVAIRIRFAFLDHWFDWAFTSDAYNLDKVQLRRSMCTSWPLSWFLQGLVALLLRRSMSTSNFYVAWERSLMYSAPTIVLTLKDMFGSADLFCTSWALLNYELFYDWSE